MSEENGSTTVDHAGVVIHPPVLLAGSLGVGLALHYGWPIGVVPGGLERPLGIPLVAAALTIFVLAVRQFVRSRTSIPTNLPTTAIVRTGPYRFSRNPIYLSFALLQGGIAIWVNSAWLVATLVVSLVVLSLGVIAREERYLERKFGGEYLDYKAKVRRWI